MGDRSIELIASRGFDWPRLPGQPELEPGRVDLVATVQDADFDAGDADFSILTEAEIARVNRFRFDQHRNRWLFGRMTLKRLLARYLACEVEEIGLGFGAIGKPFVREPASSSIHFNYTDSNGHLVYAFSKDIELGVDLEYLPRRTAYVGLAKRKLTDAEQAAFQALPEEHRELGFLANWTRKEAYGKALGVGIRFPMRAVTLCEDYGDPCYSLSAPDGKPMSLLQFKPPYSGIACAAMMARDYRIETFTL